MFLHRIRWTSLSTRIVVGTVLAFQVCVWSLAWYTSQSQRAELEQRISAQQFAVLGLRLDSLQSDFDERTRALQTVARDISPRLLAQPSALQQLLAQRPLLNGHFNAGAAVLDAQGRVLASTANVLLPAGSVQMGNVAVQAALQHAQTGTSVPRMREGNDHPPHTVTVVPLLREDGQAMGAVAGATRLLDDNFLDQFVQVRDAADGVYLLVAPQVRIVVTASDKRSAPQALPAPGLVPAEDAFDQGREGSAVYTNAEGVEVLGSSRRLNNPPWDLRVVQPTATVFASVARQQQHLLRVAGVISLLGLLLGVPWLRRELRPVREAAQALQDMGAGLRPQQPLPVPRQAEVGELVVGFNQLLQTLGEREALLRDLFDTASVGILLVDTQTRLTQVNQCMAEMFGSSMEELLGMEYADLVATGEREVARARALQLLRSGLDSVDVDRQFVRRDGSIFWGRLTGRRVYGPDGQLRGLLGAITDITERQRLQQFDRFRSQTLEKLARDEPLDDILLHTVRGVEDISPGALCSCILLAPDGRTLGRSIGPSLPQFYNDAIVGLPIGVNAGSCGAAAALGRRVVVESIATHPNWVPYKDLAAQAGLAACWSQPIVGSDGRVLGTFAIYHAQPNTPDDDDVTIIEQSARLAAIAIERSEAARRLRESEEHFRLLTEGVSDVVWRLDAQRVVTYISPADERLRGYTAQEVVGQHVFSLLTPQSAETVEAAYPQRLVASGDATGGDTLTLVLEQKCKDGSTVWTEVRSTAERDAQGQIVGYRGTSRDISERRKTESRLQLAASVLTHAQEGIMITSPEGHILEVNAAFSEITGYSRNEAIGATPRLLRSGRQGPDFYQAMFQQLATDGRWHGEVWNRRKSGSLFVVSETISAVRDSAGRLQHYVSLFSDITALKEQQQRLEHSAHFDALTDLPNRVLLMDRLQQAMVQAQRRGEPMALVFLDLDGFKGVNDQYGHALGDALLRALATRMRAALRDGDTLARLGGDEFVAVLVDLPQTQACLPMLQRLLHAAAQAVQLGGRQLQVSASLGVTFYPQAQELGADALLRQADHAMYQAKLAGKNRYHLYVADLPKGA